MNDAVREKVDRIESATIPEPIATIDLTPLREAVERVRDKTSEDFVTALVNFGGPSGQDRLQVGIYVNGETTWSETLETAEAKSLAAYHNTKDHKLAKARELRAQADALEREAKA